MKKCTKCGEEKPATTEYFYKVKDRNNGLNSVCKACAKKQNAQYRKEHVLEIKKRNAQNYKKNLLERKEYNAQWRKNNSGKIKEYHMQLYKDNSEKMKEWQKQYRKNNPGKTKKQNAQNAQYRKEHVLEIKKQRAQYRKENAEKIKKRNAQYCKEHPEIRRIQEHRRRARKRELPATLTAEQWQGCKEYFNNKCAYCGKDRKLSQDHFIALSQGGEYTINNTIPACKRCNSSKGVKDFFEWYATIEFYSKLREKRILKYLQFHEGAQQLKLN